MTTEVTPIPSLRRVYKDTKANLDALTGLQDEDLGYATDETILYRQNGAGAANWEAITTYTPNTKTDLMIPSDVLRNSNDAEKTTATSSMVKIKEVLLNADLPACRLKFDLKTSTYLEGVRAQVYKNGVGIGSAQDETSDSYVTKSQDFADFVSGDLIQIYAKYLESATAYVKNMRFHYTMTRKLTHLSEYELTTELDCVIATTPIDMTNQDP